MTTRIVFEAFTAPLLASLLIGVGIGAAACAPSTPSDSGHTEHAALGAAGSVLGSARSFAVLGGSTVTSTGATTIVGNLGVSPGTAITGFPPGLVSGETHRDDAVAQQAQLDVAAAYDALAAEACTVDLSGQDLGGLTLTPGVYCFSSAAQLTGTLVLDAGGRSDAVFVFKIGSSLTTASGAAVRVVNGANECGVFWQVGSSATLGTGTTLAGNVLAQASVTLTTGARVNGRTLARTGAVTLDANGVSLPACAVANDAGAGDASTSDGAVIGTDAAAPESEAGTPDANVADAAVVEDAGSADASMADAGNAVDAAVADGAACCSTTMCGGACVDLATDSTSCGACGHACASGESCTNGACAALCN